MARLPDAAGQIRLNLLFVNESLFSSKDRPRLKGGLLGCERANRSPPPGTDHAMQEIIGLIFAAAALLAAAAGLWAARAAHYAALAAREAAHRVIEETVQAGPIIEDSQSRVSPDCRLVWAVR